MEYKIIELKGHGTDVSYMIKKKGFFGYSEISAPHTFKELYFGTTRPKLFGTEEKAVDWIKEQHLKEITIISTKTIK